jgi:HSP20 family protein
MSRPNASGWMWPEACAMLARSERLQHQFFHVAWQQCHPPVWEPPVDVIETSDHVYIFVALPGVDPKTVGAEINGRALLVGGERLLPDTLHEAIIHRLELPHGRFARSIPLPAGQYSDVQSATANGCLVVTLTKNH